MKHKIIQIAAIPGHDDYDPTIIALTESGDLFARPLSAPWDYSWSKFPPITDSNVDKIRTQQEAAKAWD